LIWCEPYPDKQIRCIAVGDQALVVFGHKGGATSVDRSSERGAGKSSSMARRCSETGQTSTENRPSSLTAFSCHWTSVLISFRQNTGMPRFLENLETSGNSMADGTKEGRKQKVGKGKLFILSRSEKSVFSEQVLL